MTRALAFDSITFSSNEREILRGVYVNVEPGRITGLLGRNGSGKSLLLKIAADQISPSHGNVFIDGVTAVNYSRTERFANIAYLSQDSFLPPDMSVRNLITVSCNSTMLLGDEIIKTMLEKKISELSGGDRRYFEICFILSLNRKYILLDEPFTGLSPIYNERICALIRAVAKQGAGILVVDHYHHFLLPLIDVCYLLRDGYCRRIESEGSTLNEELAKEGYMN